MAGRARLPHPPDARGWLSDSPVSKHWPVCLCRPWPDVIAVAAVLETAEVTYRQPLCLLNMTAAQGPSYFTRRPVEGREHQSGRHVGDD